MKRVIAWFATNHVAANLLMGFAVLAGLSALTQIPVKLYPDFDVPVISVTVEYLGAAPQEVETGVCARVEEAIEGLVGIRQVISLAKEGVCTLTINLFFDADKEKLLAEIENQVNAIDTFPSQAEKPIFQLAEVTSVVAEVALTGPSDERELKELARNARDHLLRMPEITQAQVTNSRPYEISVEVSRDSLLRNDLSFTQVADALRQRSLDLPGGSIKTSDGEVLLRSTGQAYWGEELEALAITTRPDGTRVLLKDVARVVDGFADTGQSVAFDGKPAALIQVSRTGDQDIREVSAAIKRFTSEAPALLGEDVEVTLWRDDSMRVSNRLAALVGSGVQGLLLVLILLALFLRPHLALWVAAGIPIAFLGAIFLLYALGYSIDFISLIGFILAIGMLVDDAVVVGERAHVFQQRGDGQLSGAIQAAQDVMVPVTFGVLTTAAAFAPMLFAEGTIGQIVNYTAATVICCLVFSLIECQLVLPAHLGHRSSRVPLGEFGLTFLMILIVAVFAFSPNLSTSLGLSVVAISLVWAAHLTGHLGRLGAAFARMQVRFESMLEAFIHGGFARLLESVLQARRITLSIAVFAIILSVATVLGGHLPYVMFLPVQGDRVVARLIMSPGAPEELTKQALSRLSTSAHAVQAKLAVSEKAPPVLHIVEVMGSHPSSGIGLRSRGVTVGANLGEVAMQLTPGETRDISTNEVARLWREATGPLPDAKTLVFITNRVQPRNEIDLLLRSGDLDELQAAVAAVKRELSQYSGVFDISDSLQEGKDELRLSLKPAGEALGLTLSQLAGQVRQAFYGEEVQRIQRGRDDVRLMVRYTEQERRSLDSLYGMRVQVPGGGEVPLAAVAELESAKGYSTITRTDGQRSINVMARVSPEEAGLIASIDAGLFDDLIADFDGVNYSVISAQEQQDIVTSMLPVLFLSGFAIFALLAIPLRSYTQTLMVLSVIPFAFVGAVFGHLFMKLFGDIPGLSLPSLLGMLAASGVVVNATLVLLEGFNNYRAAGESMQEALTHASISRFRPILITTVTTFVGLVPFMASDSVQAQSLIPMAVSLAFGVVAASTAALLVVPAFWLFVQDVQRGARRVTGAVGELVGDAPRLSRWAARFPYVEESLRTREFQDLMVTDGLGLDEESAQIARRGLVRVYYEREFSLDVMSAQLDAVAVNAPKLDDLVVEVRTWAEQRSFQLGVHMLRGVISPRDAAAPLSDILQACLGALASAAKKEVSLKHPELRQGQLMLIGLGELGRREFATGSSLEFMLVYDQAGRRSGLTVEDPQPAYSQVLRLFERLLRDLSPEDMLFQVGPGYAPARQGAGVIAFSRLQSLCDSDISIPDLRRLVHARSIYSEGELDVKFEHLRRTTISGPQDLKQIADNLEGARAKLRADAPRKNYWEVTGIPGGLREAEFAAECLQLAHASRVGEMRVNGLVPTFETAAARGLLDPQVARDFIAAVNLWQNLNGFIRMTFPESFNPKEARAEQKQIIVEFCGLREFPELPNLIADRALKTSRHLDRLLEELRRLG